MPYLRLIHPSHWQQSKNRFASLAFKNSSSDLGGGISIIERDCAEKQSGTVCAHVGTYYDVKFPIPVLIWQIDDGTLPAHRLKQVSGPKGDPCHHDIIGLSDGHPERLFKAEQKANGWNNFLLCLTAGAPGKPDQGSIDAWIVAHA